MWRVALALVVVLTACSASDKKRVREVLKHVDVVGEIAQVLARSDTLIVSDVLSVDRTPSLTQYQCITETNTCTRTGTPLFEPPASLTDLVQVTANSEVERSDIRKYRGIDLAEYSHRQTRQGAEWVSSHYGAWLDYSAFETTITQRMSGGNVDAQTGYNLSFGQRSRTAPQASATWTGMMLGHTRGQDTVQALRGDATIRFALDSMTVDVSFSNIKNLDTGAAQPVAGFSGIQVRNDGAFTNRTATAHIAGRFYGPAHEEVGGVFTYPTAMGAFGGRKP